MSKLIKDIKHDYIIVQKGIVQAPSLSLKAKGVYSLLLSLPDNWEFSVKSLRTFGIDGKASITSAIKELEDACLLKRIMRFSEDGSGKIEGCDYVISDRPFMPSEPFTENRQMDEPFTENRQTVSQNCNSLHDNELFNQCEDEFAESEKREKKGEKETEKESFIKEKEKEKSPQKREIENTNNQLFVTKKKMFIPPTLQEIRDYIKAEGIDINAEHFYSHYSDPDRNWKLANGKRMDNWKLAIRTWSRNKYSFASRPKTSIERRIEENKERYQGEESEAYEGPCFIGGLDEDII